MTDDTHKELLLQVFRLASNMVNEAIFEHDGMVVAPDGPARDEMRKIQRAFSDFNSELRKVKHE